MCSLTLAFAAFSAYQQSEANNSAQSYNAAVAEANAKTSEYKAQDAQARGEQEAISQNRKTAMLRGEQRAQYAARGLDLGYGSTQAAIDQTDYFGQVDLNTVRDNAARESWANRVEAGNFKAQARQARNSKTDSLLAGATAGAMAWAGGVSSKWAPAAKTAPIADTWGVGSNLSGGRSYSGLGLKKTW